MTGDPLYDYVLLAVLVMCPIVLLIAFFKDAEYGRHTDAEEPRLSLPVRLAWILMESPSVMGFAYFYFRGPNAGEILPLFFLAMWASHYLHRGLIYPFQMKVGRVTEMPVKIVSQGFLYNVANSFVNATWISTYGYYPLEYVQDPRFIIGLVVFITGFVINRHADAVLRNLRKPGETGYKIPRGGLYEKISCPNYFGEVVIWSGWAIATWSLAGLSFALITFANLVPRAIANHRWYREQFDDYPAKRRAVIPYVL